VTGETISVPFLRSEKGRPGELQVSLTQTNTLLFNFFASTFPLFFLIHSLGYKFGDIVNDKLVVAEILTTLICTVGVILTVPITSYLVYKKANKKLQKHS